MKIIIKFIFIYFLINSKAFAINANDWLSSEIDNILNAYKNENISKVERFEFIENTIDKNFAGSGIAKFVAGKAWAQADKEVKKTYINLFKRHLALNIASMMQGYSKQTYSLINTIEDEKNNLILIDMEVKDETNKLLITWRLKENTFNSI